MLTYLLALVIVLVAALLAFAAAALLHLHGTGLVVMVAIILSIGFIMAAVILVLHLRAKKGQAQEDGVDGGAGNSEIDILLNDANRKLRSSQQGSKTLNELPLFYVLGDQDSAKTTLIMRSGLDPELIAGSAPSEGEISPTPLLNLWFTKQAAFLEAGEIVRQGTGALRKLIARTRPRAYRSAFGSGAPARAAIVCFSAECFLATDATAASLASARATGTQLREISRLLGASLPVYVIVTKLDRVTHFSEFVQNLSNEEARQVLGFTLSKNETSAGIYADKASRELNDLLDSLYYSLGEFRVEMLDRETAEQNAPGVYEFPREFSKLRKNIVQYLVELCKPSQLNANPYLRGFYFTGVRARVVEQAANVPAAPMQASSQEVGATRIFSVQDRQQAAYRPAPQLSSMGRAPQWTFLPRLLPEVILGDKSALSATQQTAPARLFRRMLFGALSAVFAICAILFLISFLNNQALERRVESAARALPASAPTAILLPALGDLQQLDNLRSIIVQLDGFSHDGPPWSYRFGLYQGDKLAVQARRIYFDRFRPALLNPAQAGFMSYLRTLPDKPAADTDFSSYGAAYYPLKAYLITAGHHDKSDPKFLTPVFLQYWLRTRQVDSAQQKLANDQIDFYGGELLRRDPYSLTADSGVVQHAREYLANFGALPRIYQGMLSAAEKTNPGIDFNRLYPGSAASVVDSHFVRGAFTRSGFDFMQEAMQHPNSYFQGEVWVLGDRAAQSLDIANVSKQLSVLYSDDFIKQWHSFMNEARVVSCGGLHEAAANLHDAASKLDALAAPNSPLLALFYTVSHNTNVADQRIKGIFQPTQAMVDPNAADRFIGAGNTNYITALLGLSGAVSQVAQNAGGATDPAAYQPIVTAASTADSAAHQAGFAFNVDSQFQIGRTVLALMEAPIDCAKGLAPSPGAQANSAGQKLCGALSPLLGKFPFAPTSTAQASVLDVNQVFAPDTGALWTIYAAGLKPYFTQQGTQFVPVADPPQPVNPAFAAYLSRLGKISSELYPPGGKSPSFSFTLRAVPSKGIENQTLVVDGQRIPAGSASQQFIWDSTTANQAFLSTNMGESLQHRGPWGVFQLVQAAKPTQASSGIFRLDIPVETSGQQLLFEGIPVFVRFELSGPGAELLAGGLSGLHCVAPVIKGK